MHCRTKQTPQDLQRSKPIQRVLRRLDGVKPSGKGQWSARCPNHNDNVPSLSVSEAEDGTVGFTCHGSCDRKDVVAAMGLEWSDLFPNDSQSNNGRGFTLKDYAEYVGLPADCLRSKFGVSTKRKPGKPPVVAIPYRDAKGGVIRTRFRIGRHVDRFRWAMDGDGTALYGLDRLADADPEKAVLLVEGESDCHVCAHHDNVLAVGVPGASSWKSEWARHLEGRDVFVWMEPDEAGEGLVDAVADDLPRAKVIEAPDDAKDPAELHKVVEGDTERFRARLGELVESSRPVEDITDQGDTVLRVEKREKYKTISTRPLEDDDRLSWKAAGIHTYLVSRPDGWSFNRADLVNRHTDGRAAVSSGLEELEEAGYLRRPRRRTPDGKLRGWRWTVSETPKDEWASEGA